MDLLRGSFESIHKKIFLFKKNNDCKFCYNSWNDLSIDIYLIFFHFLDA